LGTVPKTESAIRRVLQIFGAIPVPAAALQMSRGQLMVVQNTDYFNPVIDFPVVDNVAQGWVLSVRCPDILAALPKPGIAGEKFKRYRQIVNIFPGLFVTPL
jgi:hypothetical protein